MPSLSRPTSSPRALLAVWLALPLLAAGCLTTTVAGDVILPTGDGTLPLPDTVITGDVPADVVNPQPDVIVQPPPELSYSEAVVPYVLPGDGRGFITSFLATATTDVKIVMYLFTDDELIQAVADTARRGVRVRMLIDSSSMTRNDNATAVSQLTAAGVQVMTGPSSFVFTHQKSIIVDDSRILIMTCNFTRAAFVDNREYAVLDSEPDDVSASIQAFEADWNRTGINLTAARPVFSPDNARDRLTRFLAQAVSTIELEVEALGDPTLVQILVDRATFAGVRVRLLLDERHVPDEDIDRLRATPNVQVRTIRGITIHSKMVIVDGVAAYVGSVNLTANSLDNNRELGVLTRNAATLSRFKQFFEQGWSSATEP